MKKGFIDTETRSPVSLTTAGGYRYSTQVEVIIVTWALGDAPAKIWDVVNGPSKLAELCADVATVDELWAHNAGFDRTQLSRMAWWPKHLAPLSKWRCTMAQALAHGLPGGLDHLCEIFKVDADKAKLDGSKYIQLFCKPRADGGWNDKTTHPQEWREFLQYAAQDIPAMREVHRLCPKWNLTPKEIDLWHLDQRINDRGFAVDVDFAEAAVRATTAEKKRLSDRTQALTDGMVDRTTQRDRLLVYLLLEHGVDLPDMKADTIERRLEDPELPEYVKELLRIRLQASKSSTAKYRRVLQMNVGGRLYGTLQYCAANRTGRWGGRGFQPHNLQRPTHKQPEIDAGIEAFKAGCEDLVTDNIMALASSSMRGVIIAAPGKKLPRSDLSNIEGRKLAWLADEEWKLQAFRDYDAGIGADLYKVSYARAFNTTPDTVEDDSDERQIGKVMELALGYQGGVNAFVTMAATYGVDLDELADKAWHTIPAATLIAAQAAYARAKTGRRTYGLSEKVWVVCEALKILWRSAHPGIVTLWEQVENAVRNAIQNPGIKFEVNGKLEFDRIKNWLRVKLPSGRYLCYPNPRLDGHNISYAGVSVYSKKWHRISSYGGKFVENITQASSRDVLAWAMPKAEAAGYPIVLTVHDELVTETPNDSRFDDKALSLILAQNDDWNLGLPLAAKGLTTYRYGK